MPMETSNCFGFTKSMLSFHVINVCENSFSSDGYLQHGRKIIKQHYINFQFNKYRIVAASVVMAAATATTYQDAQNHLSRHTHSHSSR